MTLDSRLSTHGSDGARVPPLFAEAVGYSSSEVGEVAGGWIQRPISLQLLDPSECLIDGIYAQTRGRGMLPIQVPGLAWELEAWEAASDEALSNFEAECG